MASSPLSEGRVGDGCSCELADGGLAVVPGVGGNATNFIIDGSDIVLAGDHPWLVGSKRECSFRFYSAGGVCLAHVVAPGPLGARSGDVWRVPLVALGSASLAATECTRASRLPLGLGDPLVVLPHRRVGDRAPRFVCAGRAGVLRRLEIGGRLVSAREYTSNTEPGDCGAAVIGADGIEGTHIAYLPRESVNLFLPWRVAALESAEPSDLPGLVPPGDVVFEGKTDGAPAVRIVLPGTAVSERGRARRGSVRSRGSRASARSRSSRRSKPSGRGRRAGRSAGPRRRPRPAKAVPYNPFDDFESGAVHEDGIVGIDPAPSDNLAQASRRSAVSGAQLVSDYVEMLVNPWCAKSVRLPDHVITPTCTFKLFANRTYTFADGSVAAAGSTAYFGMHTRLSSYGSTPPASASGVSDVAGTPTVRNVYQYTPGNILTPVQFGNGSLWTRVGSVTPASSGAPWGDDFGEPQASMASWITAYRVLSAGIRLRVVGLPDNQFMAPGKAYFAAIRYDRDDIPYSEQDFVTLERLGRASHVSLDAVRASGSKTFFILPDGPEKFAMSSTFLPAPGVVADVSGSAYRSFQLSDATAGNFLGQAVPYSPSNSLAAAEDQANADQTYVLLLALFGVKDGLIVEVDYAQNGEYIADRTAPPGIDSITQPPNTAAVDQILAAAAVMSDLRPVMLQAKGDVTVASEGRPPPSLTPVTEAVSRIGGAAFRPLIKSEGWLDSLWSLGADALGGVAKGFLRSNPGAGELEEPPRRMPMRRRR